MCVIDENERLLKILNIYEREMVLRLKRFRIWLESPKGLIPYSKAMVRVSDRNA